MVSRSNSAKKTQKGQTSPTEDISDSKEQWISQKFIDLEPLARFGTTAKWCTASLTSNPKETVALKINTVLSPQDFEITLLFLERMIGYRHPNIVTVIEFDVMTLESERQTYLVAYELGAGSLQSNLQKNIRFDKLAAVRFLVDALTGLTYAKEHHGLYHGNIKPSKFIKMSNGSFKLTDWGPSIALKGRILKDCKSIKRTQVPDEEFLPPELIFRGNKKSMSLEECYAADIFSLAITTMAGLGCKVSKLKEANTDLKCFVKVLNELLLDIEKVHGMEFANLLRDMTHFDISVRLITSQASYRANRLLAPLVGTPVKRQVESPRKSMRGKSADLQVNRSRGGMEPNDPFLDSLHLRYQQFQEDLYKNLSGKGGKSHIDPSHKYPYLYKSSFIEDPLNQKNHIELLHESKLEDLSETYDPVLNRNRIPQETKECRASFYHNLGLACQRAGDLKKALNYLNQSLSYADYDSPLLMGRILNNIGYIHRKAKDYEKASSVLHQALEVRLNYLEDDHPDIADSYHHLGLLYIEMDNKELALKYLRQAHDVITKNDLKTRSSEERIVSLLEDLGDLCFSLEQPNEALTYYQTSLEKRVKRSGAHGAEVAALWMNIGLVYESLKQYSNAIDVFLKAKEIRKYTYPSNHPAIAQTAYSLGLNYKLKGELELSKVFLHNALLIYEQNFSEDHPAVIATRQLLD